MVQDFVQQTADEESPTEWLHRIMDTSSREEGDYDINLLGIYYVECFKFCSMHTYKGSRTCLLRLQDTHVGIPTCLHKRLYNYASMAFFIHTLYNNIRSVRTTKTSDRANKPAAVGWFVSYQISRQKSQLGRAPASSFLCVKYSSTGSSVLQKLGLRCLK